MTKTRSKENEQAKPSFEQAEVSEMPKPVMDPIPNPTGPAFFVQVGSFSEMSNAHRLSNDLGSSLPVDVALANVNGADYFRVLVGPYTDRSEASNMRDQLDFSGIVDGVVITGQK